MTDYRGAHRAPGRRNGAPMFDLTANGVYPCDVYTHPRYYLDPSSPWDRESWRAVERVRCAPAALVTIYRAVPSGAAVINPGDWVTPSRSYAKQHAIDLLGPGADGVVLSIRTSAATLFTNGNSINAWGFDP
jgi:hypothetical protein